MKKIISVLLYVFMFMPALSSADSTISQSIIRIQYDGASEEAYFIGTNPWVTTCSNSTYVAVVGSLAGRDQMLSIALTAQASGKKISFLGVCDTAKQVFVAHYITLQ